MIAMRKNKRNGAGGAVRMAGMVATAMAGALVMTFTAPQARTAVPTAVSLTSTSSSVQAALDQLLAEMQRIVTQDAALSYAPPGSEADVLPILQNTNYQLLMAGVSRVTELFNGWFFQSPEVVAGDATDPRQYFDFFTPDIYYHVTAGLAPGATYQLTGTLGGATEHFSISTEAITAGTAQTVGSLELGHGLVVNPDGTFTVVIGPDNPGDAANFMNDTDATTGGAASLLIRDMLGDWAKGPGSVSIHCVADCPAFFAIPEGGFFPADDSSTAGDAVAGVSAGQTGSIDSLLTTLFSAFAQVIGPFNERSIAGGASVGMGLPANTMGDLGPETSFGAGLESAAVSGGNFDLDPDQALIVKVPDVTSAYSGMELMNVFGAALPYTMAQTTLNNTTAFHDADGYTYYVVSATNPGVANWLDSGTVDRGEIFARFENVADTTTADGLAVQTQVVPIADVAQYLPADTPTVSPAEYAADMAQRVFSYDYGLDVSRSQAQPDWLIQELLLHGMRGLVGNDNFDAVFGGQSFTPIELRLTPALSPDWDTVFHDILTNPSASLSAIFNNLPLISSDINLPLQLAGVEPLLALLFPGQQPGSLLNDMLFDPNSGILAGFLNARDDFATAVLSANNDFPTALGDQATQEWANMGDLIQSTPNLDLADLGSLFNSLPGM